jgi:hypothetical protein
VLRASDTISKMDMPIHQEIERSNHIQEDLFDNESDNEAVEDNALAPRHPYGMIFDVQQEIIPSL